MKTPTNPAAKPYTLAILRSALRRLGLTMVDFESSPELRALAMRDEQVRALMLRVVRG